MTDFGASAKGEDLFKYFGITGENLAERKKKNLKIINENCRIKNISLKINGEKILENISLTLNKGEITTLIGPNGGGKTSIARIILEILKPTSGQLIKNKNLKIGYMPQKISLDKDIPLSCLDFINLLNGNKNFDKI